MMMMMQGGKPPQRDSPALLQDPECLICRNNFDGEVHLPKLLECLHTFCLQCLSQIHLQAAIQQEGEQQGEAIVCPLCRHPSALLDGSLPSLLQLRHSFPPAGSRQRQVHFQSLETPPGRPLQAQSSPNCSCTPALAPGRLAAKTCVLVGFSLVGVGLAAMATYAYTTTKNILGSNTNFPLLPLLIVVSISCFLVVGFIMAYYTNTPKGPQQNELALVGGAPGHYHSVQEERDAANPMSAWPRDRTWQL